MTGGVKVGVIGLGEVGRHQANGVVAAPGATLAAVADFNEEFLSSTVRETGASGFATADELIEKADVDAIIVCVPHKFHIDLCRKALASGRHVLVEKPVTVSVAEADELIAIAGEKGKLFGASHNQIFYPPHVWLKEAVSEGRLARPTVLRLKLAIGGKLGGWRADPDLTGGGLLFDAGFHRFYVARSIMGEVAAVTANLDADDPRGIGENVGLVILEFRDGGRAVIEAGYFAPPGVFDDSIEAVTADALVRIPGLEAHFEKFSAEPELLIFRDGVWSEASVPVVAWPETVARSVANFVDAIRGNGRLAADGAEARRIVEIVEAVYQSSREGCRIEI